jgi:Ca2+-binding EF-hand superfamily protein
MKTYQRFFYEFDKNRDGLIQKQEMARFIRHYLENYRNVPVDYTPSYGDDWVRDQVDKAWYQYDIDGSNYLDKQETMTFLENFLQENNQPPPTIS